MSRSPAGPERWTARTAARRARELLAEEGARSLVMGVLAETVYRRLVLFEQEVDGRPQPNPLGLELGFLGADRLDEYEAFRPGQRAVAERRLAAGPRCSVYRLDGAIVAARWLGTGAPWIDYLGFRLPLAEHEIYLFDSFTAPEHRGRGIAWIGQRLILATLAAEGYLVALGSCLPENRSGWRSLVKGGFRPVGKMGYVGFGPWRREFVRR